MCKQGGLYPSIHPFESEKECSNACSKSILLPVHHVAVSSAMNIFWLFVRIYVVFVYAFFLNACQCNTSNNKEVHELCTVKCTKSWKKEIPLVRLSGHSVWSWEERCGVRYGAVPVVPQLVYGGAATRAYPDPVPQHCGVSWQVMCRGKFLRGAASSSWPPSAIWRKALLLPQNGCMRSEYFQLEGHETWGCALKGSWGTTPQASLGTDGYLSQFGRDFVLYSKE